MLFYFNWVGTSTYGHGRNIQIWDSTTKFKSIVESFIHCSAILISQGNSIFPVFIIQYHGRMVDLHNLYPYPILIYSQFQISHYVSSNSYLALVHVATSCCVRICNYKYLNAYQVFKHKQQVKLKHYNNH